MKELSYRKKEQPTGEEVNSIVKFHRIIVVEHLKVQNERTLELFKRSLKITAVLIAVSTAVIIAAIVAAVCYLK